MELYVTGVGQIIMVHEGKGCIGPCPIHNPTDHCMRSFPTLWRDDRKIMERICSHGVGHPDPDCRNARLLYESIHGCDGCCIKPKEV